MKIKTLLILCVASVALISNQDDRLSKIINPGTKAELLAEGFLFTEGPACDANGNIYFTDQPNNRIMVWSNQDKLSTFMQPAGRSNGLSFDNKGNLWACADEKNELWCISADKKVQVIPSKFKGKALNGPNDLWNMADGGVYFTDPFYKRSWWDHDSMPQKIQGVYYLSPDHTVITLVAEDLVQPNGITGTADGKTLFIADIGAGKTWKYSISGDGSLKDKKLFCEMGSDGMTIDTKGNIYLTGNGVSIFNPEGKFIGNVPIPENWTANVCFGGKDMKSLYITASKGLYRIRTLVKGVR
jgi:gluconolactonase